MIGSKQSGADHRMSFLVCSRGRTESTARPAITAIPSGMQTSGRTWHGQFIQEVMDKTSHSSEAASAESAPVLDAVPNKCIKAGCSSRLHYCPDFVVCCRCLGLVHTM